MRERDTVSRRRTGISCNCGPRGSQCLQSKTINVGEARTGEKLNSKETRKRKAEELQEFDEFEVKVKVVKSEARITQGKKLWTKWVETRKDPNKPWYESFGLSPREGSTQSKSRTMCTKRCGFSSGYFRPHPRQRFLQRVQLARLGGTEIPFRSTW